MRLETRSIHGRTALIFILLLSLSACGSQRGGARQGGSERTEAQVAALAGPVAQPVAVLFAAMDADGDLVVSVEEAAAGIAREWRRLDRGGEGKVTAVQLGVWAEAALGNAYALPGFLAFDVNQDGAVTQKEFTDRLLAEFRALDLDHDGRLKRSELLRLLPSGGAPPRR